MTQQQTTTPFEAGIQIYMTPRVEGEADLVPLVRGMLSDSGVAEQTLSVCYDGNRHVKAAVDKNSVAQRGQLNRFLELALLRSYESTTALRSELLPNGSVSNWIDVVKDRVVPFIATRKLLE